MSYHFKESFPLKKILELLSYPKEHLCGVVVISEISIFPVISLQIKIFEKMFFTSSKFPLILMQYLAHISSSALSGKYTYPTFIP